MFKKKNDQCFVLQERDNGVTYPQVCLKKKIYMNMCSLPA